MIYSYLFRYWSTTVSVISLSVNLKSLKPPSSLSLLLCPQLNHLRCLHDFAEAQATYFAQCHHYMQDLQRELNRWQCQHTQCNLMNQKISRVGGRRRRRKRLDQVSHCDSLPGGVTSPSPSSPPLSAHLTYDCRILPKKINKFLLWMLSNDKNSPLMWHIFLITNVMKLQVNKKWLTDTFYSYAPGLPDYETKWDVQAGLLGVPYCYSGWNLTQLQHSVIS